MIAAAFPRCFIMPRSKLPKAPLKIGIREDLLAKSEQIGLSEERLRAALSDYVSGIKYQRAILERSVRLDLDGNPAGEVTAGHKAHAKGMLRKIERRWRRAKERVK